MIQVCHSSVLQKRGLFKGGGWALARVHEWLYILAARVHGICILEYSESFNGYSLVSENIMVQEYMVIMHKNIHVSNSVKNYSKKLQKHLRKIYM